LDETALCVALIAMIAGSVICRNVAAIFLEDDSEHPGLAPPEQPKYSRQTQRIEAQPEAESDKTFVCMQQQEHGAKQRQHCPFADATDPQAENLMGLAQSELVEARSSPVVDSFTDQAQDAPKSEFTISLSLAYMPPAKMWDGEGGGEGHVVGGGVGMDAENAMILRCNVSEVDTSSNNKERTQVVEENETEEGGVDDVPWKCAESGDLAMCRGRSLELEHAESMADCQPIYSSTSPRGGTSMNVLLPLPSSGTPESPRQHDIDDRKEQPRSDAGAQALFADDGGESEVTPTSEQPLLATLRSQRSPAEAVLSAFGDMDDDSQLTFEQGICCCLPRQR
jgi:hypothetical protein